MINGLVCVVEVMDEGRGSTQIEGFWKDGFWRGGDGLMLNHFGEMV